jgi:hypothetical protein
MRYLTGLIFALFLLSCSGDSNYIEFPYKKFGKDVKTKIGTVFFEKGSFQLSSTAHKDVMVIVRTLSLYERYNDTQRIRIIGYADQEGESSLNLQLGLARAEEVGRVLENFGISMTKAKIGSYGESLAYINDKAFRKAEVWLENNPWAFLHNKIFIYIFIAIVMSFLIGFITNVLLKRNYFIR